MVTKMMKIIGRKSQKKVNQEILLNVKNEMNLLLKMEQDIKDSGKIV